MITSMQKLKTPSANAALKCLLHYSSFRANSRQALTAIVIASSRCVKYSTSATLKKSKNLNGYANAVNVLYANVNSSSSSRTTQKPPEESIIVNTQIPDDEYDARTSTKNNTEAKESNTLCYFHPKGTSYAIFVDGQNASVNHFSLVLRDIDHFLPQGSLPTIKNIYGDAKLLEVNRSPWFTLMERYGLHSPYHYQNTNIDSLLVMDVMEALYRYSHIQTYILVTGDGDFAPLVHRLREGGKTILGYGATKNTATVLASACHRYIYTEDLMDAARKRVKSSKKERMKYVDELIVKKKLEVEKKQLDEEKRQLEEVKNRSLKENISAFFFGSTGGLEQINSVSKADGSEGCFEKKALPPISISSPDERDYEKKALPPISISSPRPKLVQSTRKDVLVSINEALRKFPSKHKEHEGWVALAILSFDYKAHGYKRFSQLILDMYDEVETKRDGSTLYIRPR